MIGGGEGGVGLAIGNRFNDFPEIVPTIEITTKIEKTFLVRGRGPVC